MEAKLIFKQIAWRLTAGWFWLYAIATVFRSGEYLEGREHAFFSGLNEVLTYFGFPASSSVTFEVGIKLLWLLMICSFSWAQIIGFILYVPFLPIVLLVRVVLRKRLEPYREIRRKSYAEHGSPLPTLNWGSAYMSFLLLWLILYGNASTHIPILVAMFLTALLFCSRVSRALMFAIPMNKSTWGRVEAMRVPVRNYLINTSESIKKGEILEKWIVNLAFWTGSFLLRRSRSGSRRRRGRSSRTRIALAVLLRFMFNLAVLGGISILFWALAIKYVMAPSYIGFAPTLLASASRAIPGIPDASGVTVPASIQVLDSLAAWLIFVLYAGPVASLFPEFQKNAIERSISEYRQLLDARKSLYRTLEKLRPIRDLVNENPELAKISKAAFKLRGHTEAEMREALLSNEDTLRMLVNSPELVGLLKTFGVSIPDLGELIREVPPLPNHQSRSTQSESSSEQNDPDDQMRLEGKS